MEKLKEIGWSLNETLLEEFFDDGIPKNVKEIEDVILNEDIREYSNPCIIDVFNKEQGIFRGPCVLQFSKYRNVGVPRIREEFGNNNDSSAIIRLFLTDGHSTISALLTNPIKSINANTPPGTKLIVIGDVSAEGQFLDLNDSNIRVLGGKVDKLIEKWNAEKNSLRNEGFKGKTNTGAPKWISFGKKITVDGHKKGLTKGFKANDALPANKIDDVENDEFKKNRDMNLKNLSTSDGIKTFCKPNVELPDKKENPKPFVEKTKQTTKEKPAFRKKRRGRNDSDGEDIDVGEYAHIKPSAAPTLVDFISEIVPATVQTRPQDVPQNNQKRTFDGVRNKRDGNRSIPERGRNDKNHRPSPRHNNVDNLERDFQKMNFNNKSNSNYNDKFKKSEHDNTNKNTAGKNLNRFNKNSERNFNQQAEKTFSNSNKNERSYIQSDKSLQNLHNPKEKFYKSDKNIPKDTKQRRQNTPNDPRDQKPDFKKRNNPNQFGRNDDASTSRQFDDRRHMKNQGPNWNIGSQCLAPWQDGQIYPARIKNIMQNRMCSVVYDGYGNEAVLPLDVLLLN